MMLYPSFFAAFFLLRSVFCSRCLSRDEILQAIFDEGDEKKDKLRPTIDATEVVTEIWVQSFTKISDITSDFHLDLYLNEEWNDPSLDYSKLEVPACNKNISVHHRVLEKMWTPNSCFINSKTAKIHHTPGKNTFVMIYENGSVWTNYRLQLTGMLLLCFS